MNMSSYLVQNLYIPVIYWLFQHLHKENHYVKRAYMSPYIERILRFSPFVYIYLQKSFLPSTAKTQEEKRNSQHIKTPSRTI